MEERRKEIEDSLLSCKLQEHELLGRARRVQVGVDVMVNRKENVSYKLNNIL